MIINVALLTVFGILCISGGAAWLLISVEEKYKISILISMAITIIGLYCIYLLFKIILL